MVMTSDIDVEPHQIVMKVTFYGGLGETGNDEKDRSKWGEG
jgi:hypothetical protein